MKFEQLTSLLACVLVCFYTWPTVLATDFCETKYKSLESEDGEQARILHGLEKYRFTAQDHSDKGSAKEFIVSLCGNATKDDPLAGALLRSENHTTTLGRVNSTSVVKGGDWMMVIFGNGDPYPTTSNCSGPHVTFVLIHCSHNVSLESTMRFVKEDREKRNSCFYMLEIHTQLLCITPETIGGGSVFLLIVLIGVAVYLFGGTLYNRIILGAKGWEQIPNFNFWSSVCKLVQDGTASIFQRKEPPRDSSWQSLNRRSDRDDDSLLAP